MAFSTVIHRSLTPLAARLLAGQRGVHRGNLLIATRTTDSFSGSRYSSSTSVVKRFAPDSYLLQLIDSEIGCCERNLKADKGVPEGFAFQIKDNLGQQTVLLTRELEGEIIHVEVEPSDLIINSQIVIDCLKVKDPELIEGQEPYGPAFE
ncbi:uncharacterized protein LOC143623087 [Bidens hawaiensis]|uniref:uncharacterized protein LOC143623087 n=1 Tax=Bidens hawaiensis TaxID=980011 RepID=UPI004049B62D